MNQVAFTSAAELRPAHPCSYAKPSGCCARGPTWPPCRPSPKSIGVGELRSAIKKRLAARSLGAVASEVGSQDELALRLARAALACDRQATVDVLLSATEERARSALAAAPLIEAAADQLRGDWMTDRISEFDVSTALCTLQSALRSVRADAPAPLGARGTILVATAPDERDSVGAVLTSELLAELGFDVVHKQLKTCDELIASLASTWVDAVTLHLSPVFHRRERVANAAFLIGCARAASRNRDVIAAAHGACFGGDGTRRGFDVTTADGAFKSSVSLVGWICERIGGASGAA